MESPPQLRRVPNQLKRSSRIVTPVDRDRARRCHPSLSPFRPHDFPKPLERGACGVPRGDGVFPPSANPRARAVKISGTDPAVSGGRSHGGNHGGDATLIARRFFSGCLDFTAQGAPDEFGQAQLLPARFLGPSPLDRSREPESHRHTAFGQFRSGHAASVLLYHTHCQDPNLIAVSVRS
jgi:hypothetical protein